jgi:hypothetical protein
VSSGGRSISSICSNIGGFSMNRIMVSSISRYLDGTSPAAVLAALDASKWATINRLVEVRYITAAVRAVVKAAAVLGAVSNAANVKEKTVTNWVGKLGMVSLVWVLVVWIVVIIGGTSARLLASETIEKMLTVNEKVVECKGKNSDAKNCSGNGKKEMKGWQAFGLWWQYFLDR